MADKIIAFVDTLGSKLTEVLTQIINVVFSSK